MNKPYTVYQGDDGLWRARFSDRVARALGKMSSSIIQAPSESTASELAGILARDVMTGSLTITKKRATKPADARQLITQPNLF